MRKNESAEVQHAAYIEAWEQCGVEVAVQGADEQFPDSAFVEDTAVLTKSFAIVTNPGAASCNGEIVSMPDVLKHFYDHLDYIQAPAHWTAAMMSWR